MHCRINASLQLLHTAVNYFHFQAFVALYQPRIIRISPDVADVGAASTVSFQLPAKTKFEQPVVGTESQVDVRRVVNLIPERKHSVHRFQNLGETIDTVQRSASLRVKTADADLEQSQTVRICRTSSSL